MQVHMSSATVRQDAVYLIGRKGDLIDPAAFRSAEAQRETEMILGQNVAVVYHIGEFFVQPVAKTCQTLSCGIKRLFAEIVDEICLLDASVAGSHAE